MFDVIIIGAGPAGFMAGITAAKAGKKTVILEKMPETGRKLLICGKGRCNITNVCDINEMIKNIPGNGKFLHSALRSFDNQALMDFFRENGLETKSERGGRVFPVTDSAKDVRALLLKVFEKSGGTLKVNIDVSEILVEDGAVNGVRLKSGSVVKGRNVVLCAGGASYPRTGSDGSGFMLAEKCGHTVTELKPSLVPLVSDCQYLPELQGLSLRNVTATVFSDNKKITQEFGEMLFTHFGLSGPIILTLSNPAAKELSQNKKVEISIDLKPALSEEKLDDRLKRDFEKYSRKQIKNSLGDLLPSSLIPVVLKEAGIFEDKFTNQITKAERTAFLQTLKNLRLNITKTRPIAEAIVTAGGVSIKEIDPKTMQSKIIRGLYFAGEVIDIDGYTGGFNLQAAFSTGYAAGSHAEQGG